MSSEIELSETEAVVLKFIIDFLKDNNYEWFSYRALERYHWRHPIKHRYSWHTIERTIRKLHEKEILIKLPSKRRGRFKINQEKLDELGVEI